MVRPSDSQPSTPASPQQQHHALSAKRRKTDDGAQDSAVKKPRTRVSYSCGECHRRKQKCNREMPCSHCVARRVPELCKAYTPGKADQDLPQRVARLEQIIEHAFPHLAGLPPLPGGDDPSAGPTRRNSISDEDYMNHGPEDDGTDGPRSAGRLEGGSWFGETVSGSVAPAAVLEQLQHVVLPATKPSPASDQPQSSKGTPTLSQRGAGSPMDTKDSASIGVAPLPHEPSAADNLQRLVQDCGVSPHKVSELLQELPPRRVADALVDFYFASVNWTRYPISEREFRASYTTVCDSKLFINPAEVGFLPLLFVILAIAVRLAPEQLGGNAASRRLTSLRYYWASRRSLLLAAAVQPDSLDMILTRLLSARFLTFDRRITECWSQLGAAVRTAQALGLHRDGSTMGLDPAQVEYRRRIWSYLYHADRSYALVLGRPNAIQDEYTSTLPPSNIEDEYALTNSQELPSLTTPTHMTFVILRHALASIIGRMVHHFQAVRSPARYADVLDLDRDLMRFVNSLPPHYALDPDTSLDDALPYVPVHRHLLVTEILFVRISLHRPYLLRRLGSDRYEPSRRACFESALRDFHVRHAFSARPPREGRHTHSNAYREFQTAMISGIYLVLHPDGKDAPAMHAILDAFLAEHAHEPDLDATTRRELRIIEFLKAKAGEDRGADGSPTTDAHLLLELQHSRPSTSQGRPLSAARPLFPALVMGSPTPAGGGSPHPLFAAALSPASAPATATTFRPSALGPGAHGSLFPTYQLPSPTSGGSPGAEGESAAQSLLDQWYSSVTGPGAFDAPGTGASGGGSMGGVGAVGGLGGAFGAGLGGGVGGEIGAAWMGAAAPTPPAGTEGNAYGLDGTDWTYWETLVNQIRAPGT